METSILFTIKKLIGVDPEYDAFDTEIMTDINTAIFILKDIGVGKSDFYAISGPNSMWNDFIEDRKDFEAAKTFIHLKTKLMFDPPASSFVKEAMEKTVDEIYWRLYSRTNYPEEQNGQHQ